MFRRIAVPDPNPTLYEFRHRLQPFSEEPLQFHTEMAGSPEEMIRRCDGADAILIGWASRIPAEVINGCPGLIHIGLACTLYEGEGANVDLSTARDRGISVTGVRDYGDVGVVEWVISEMIHHLQHREPRRELRRRRIGVVGAGGAGPVALALQALGAEVSYTSRNIKPVMEAEGIPRRDMVDLFDWAEILTFHLPRNTILGGTELLSRFSGELVINTSLGLPLEARAVAAWLDEAGHWAAFDADGIGDLEHLRNHDRIRFMPYFSGFTEEAGGRLMDGVVRNLERHLPERSPAG